MATAPQTSSRNAAPIPKSEAEQTQALFARFAPIAAGIYGLIFGGELLVRRLQRAGPPGLLLTVTNGLIVGLGVSLWMTHAEKRERREQGIHDEVGDLRRLFADAIVESIEREQHGALREERLGRATERLLQLTVALAILAVLTLAATIVAVVGA